MHTQQMIPEWLQWAWAIAGLAIAAGGLVWILCIFWPFLRWSKRMTIMSYRLGEKTADHLDSLQNDLQPVIADLRDAVADVKVIVSDLRKKELEKIAKVLDDISTNGSIKETVEAIKDIPKKLEEMLKAERKKLVKNL